MRVQVLYFAALRDLTGCSEEPLELPASIASVAELLAHLAEQHQNLRGRIEGVRVAVNENFVQADTELSANDVVALIPPVAGG